jgi:hypothetical protein
MKTRGVPAGKTGPNGALSAQLNSTQHAIMFHDTFTRFIFPLCSAMQDRPDPETPISSATYLVGASNFGLKQGFDLRYFVQDISTLLAASFPEILNKVYVSYPVIRLDVMPTAV